MIRKLLLAVAILACAINAHAQVTVGFGQAYNSIDVVTTGTGVYTGVTIQTPVASWYAGSKVCLITTLAGSPSAIQVDLQSSDTGADGDFQTMVSTTNTAGETVCSESGARFHRAKQQSKTGGTTVTGSITAVTIPSDRSSTIIASATTIVPTSLVHHISGTTAIVNITVPAFCSPTCILALVPDAVYTTTAAGNISLATTAVVNRVQLFVWDGVKWNPSY